jgi:hypothetical protein
MGFIRSAMKGLKDVGRKLITPRLARRSTYGKRRRGPSQTTRTMSVRKRKKRRLRRNNKWRL